MRRIGDVELSEDMRHERREWIAQRIGWAAMGLVVAAALAGLFGSGPLARGHEESAGLAVDHPRFARDDAESELALRLDGAAWWLGREALERFTVESVTPPAARVRMAADRWVYEYDGAPGRVVVRLRPTRIGRAALRVGADGGEVRVAIVVFP